MKKTFIIVVLMLVVVTGIVVWQQSKIGKLERYQANFLATHPLVSTSTVATSTRVEWQPFINSKLGFGLSYPNYWFNHAEGEEDGGLWLTRQKVLPNFSGTEGYAYGDQISVRQDALLDQSDRPISREAFLNAEYKHVPVIKRDTVKLANYELVRVQYDTTEAEHALSYYLFPDSQTGGRVFVFWAYPASASMRSEVEEIIKTFKLINVN